MNDFFMKGLHTSSKLMEINFRFMEEMTRGNGQMVTDVLHANAQTMGRVSTAPSLQDMMNAGGEQRDAMSRSFGRWRDTSTVAVNLYRDALGELYQGTFRRNREDSPESHEGEAS